MRLLIAFLLPFLMLFTSISHASAIGNKTAWQECTYDFAVDGGAVGNIDVCKTLKLPTGTKILRLFYSVETTLTSGGSATVSIGDAGSTARYLALTAYNNAAFTGANPVEAVIGAPLSVSSANLGKPSISIAVAALTAGKIKLYLEVYTPKGN